MQGTDPNIIGKLVLGEVIALDSIHGESLQIPSNLVVLCSFLGSCTGIDGDLPSKF